MSPRPAPSSWEASRRHPCGERGPCEDPGVSTSARCERASASQARPGVQVDSLDAPHRPPRPRARQSPLSQHQVQVPGARDVRTRVRDRRERSWSKSSEISRALGGGGAKREVRHVASLAAGLYFARPRGRGSQGPPLLPAGLRKILLGQWQAGRRARIGADALLITVETRAAGNA